MFSKMLLVLVIQQAVTVPGIIGIRDLFPEFLTNALILLCPLQPAGTIATGTPEAFPDGLDHFFIVIESDCHSATSPLYGIIPYTVKNANSIFYCFFSLCSML